MDYITVSDAATQLGVSRSRVAKLCKDGTIKADLVGAHLYLIDRESLAAYRGSESRKFAPFTHSGGRYAKNHAKIIKKKSNKIKRV